MTGSGKTAAQGRTIPYVLITPARNEATFIEQTIQSVIRQTILPIKWVIVSDGSTDGTDDIVKKYTVEHRWIELARMPERRERHFAGKAHAFNRGYEIVRALHYEVIGNLDADISFEEDYLSFILGKFGENPRLGVGGTPFREEAQQYDYRFTSTEHVSGACQLFRRECFEAIGGYRPLKAGGVDLAAVISARMQGWETRTFTERTCVHHKKTQDVVNKSIKDTVRSGYHDYLMGTHPLWQISRSVYQMSRRPVLVGGAALLGGYLWAMATRAERIVPQELIAFRGKEQMARLRGFIRKVFCSGRDGYSA